jgi:hypothetical protein
VGASNAPTQNETSILQGLSPQLQQLVSGALSNTGALSSLLSGQQAVQPGYATGATGAAGGLTGLANYLQNGFQALSKPEIGALSAEAGDTVSSTAKTIASQSGGTPNPALQAQLAGQQAGQTTANEASQLGGLAAQQQLGALQTAGSALSGAGSLYSGLNSSSLQSLLGALGINTQNLQTGSGGLGNIAGLYAQQQQLANQSSPLAGITGLLGGLGGIAGTFLGGGLGGGLGSALGGGGGSATTGQNFLPPQGGQYGEGVY